MWDMVPLDSYDTMTKYKYLGRPRKIAMNPHEGLQQAEVVGQMEVCKSLIKEKIYLGDFGQAIKAGTTVSYKIRLNCIYCAPERFHKRAASFASDMWGYMCLFTQLYLDSAPFDSFWGVWDASVLSAMVDVLGPLPEHWKGSFDGAGKSEDSWYDQSTKPKLRLPRRMDKALST